MNRISSRRNQFRGLLNLSQSFDKPYTKSGKLGSIRHMADNLLGHNPMAGTVSNTNKNLGGSKDKKKNKPMIGVDSNTEGGGVWAQTSAKRDKLGELRLELDWDKGQRTLDDAASDEEKLDLFLVDGVNSIGMLVDGKFVKNNSIEGSLLNSKKLSSLKHFYSSLEEFEQSLKSSSDVPDVQIDRHQFELHISNLITHVEEIRSDHCAAPQQLVGKESTFEFEQESSSLVHIRDIMPFILPNEEIDDTQEIPIQLEKDLFNPAAQALEECVEYFRILLLQSCLQDLSTRWDDIIKVSDADLDRSATAGHSLAPPTTISLEALHQVLDAFTQGTCQDRVEALWKLSDKDQDGLIDQAEMDQVVHMSIEPVKVALKKFVTDCFDVCPVRVPLPDTDERGKGRYAVWKEERSEKRLKKVLLKLMNKAISKHFEIDVEVPHRLRCCYAWAEKEHQSGKVESVLVDTSGGVSGSDNVASSASAGAGGFLSGGKKRYVELDPKISYEEFREVQKEHFSHLDRVAEELCTSLKEEVWIHQGRGRQNSEVKRESAAFIAVVSLIDYGIFLA